MTPSQSIIIQLSSQSSISTEDPKVKAAARRLEKKGVVKIETYAANRIIRVRGRSRMHVREGYIISIAF